MALIPCPNCGKMVSDNAVQCPHCNCNLQAKKVCPNCHAEIEDDSLFCSNCGTKLTNSAAPMTPAPQKKSSLLWLWILLAVVVVAVAGVLVWVFVIDHTSYEETWDTTSVEEVITEESLVEDVANNFISAINEGNASMAKAYATDDSKDAVDAILMFAEDQFKNVNYLSDITVNGDYATAIAHRNGNDPIVLNFKKMYGEWKVEAAKEAGDNVIDEDDYTEELWTE